MPTAAPAAPLAVQVADRWHLWHNLGEAAERAVARHRNCLAAATKKGAEAVPGPAAAPPAAAPAALPRAGPVAERTRRRHAAIHQLLGQGHSISMITAELGLAGNAVRRFARAAGPEQLPVNDGTGRRPSILAKHVAYLHQR